MSINNTNENFHRQNISNADNRINENRINTSGIQLQNNILHSENQRLLEQSNFLNKQASEQIDNRLKIEHFDQQLNKQMFCYFQKLISELETTIELLKIISADNPSLHDTIKNVIHKNGLVINNNQKRDQEINIMLNHVFSQE